MSVSPETRAAAASPDAERPSLGEMFGEVSKDLSQLVRQEVELAKAEAKESATRAGKGAGMLVGAAEAAQLALVFLSVAVWWGLGNAIGRGWSALVVTVVWAVVAAALGLLGKKQVSSVNGLPRTAQTVKEIPPALKPHEEQR
ncbi:hypothetical protein ASD06_08025 [Angustibacter sp. Root456]|nr:phage holin family protein [Angustibacter sp. Root456]KQX66287.1 hypothetical protein ASD06_08025 [Angustibacter sp. Root456]